MKKMIDEIELINKIDNFAKNITDKINKIDPDIAGSIRQDISGIRSGLSILLRRKRKSQND